MENLAMTPSFWKGRRVLVTGHTGFKGGWLTLWLSRLGAEVYGLALPPPTRPSLFDTAAIGSILREDIRGDIREGAAVSAAVQKSAPEVIFHLAAQSLVGRSYREPAETFAVNVQGTVNVLQAALECSSVKGAVVVTSDKCYENHGWVHPYRENDVLGGADPYSASKACAEIVAACFRTSYCSNAQENLAIATVRAGNVVGGGDWSEDRLLPDILRAAETGTDLMLRHPTAVRPWQNVLDPLMGYIMLAEQLLGKDAAAYIGPWNFGPDTEDCLPVIEMVQIVSELLGVSIPTRILESAPDEKEVLRLDSTKARQLLGWRPRHTLREALSHAVSWHQAWRAGKDMQAVSLESIGRFRA